MKIYKVTNSAKILYAIFSLFIIFSAILILFDKQSNIILKLLTPFAFILGVGGTYSMYKFKVIITNEKIETFNFNILPIFLGKRIRQTIPSLTWDEIGEFDTRYVLYPESPIIVLKPKLRVPKEKIEFMLFGMPIELLVDIISHLPKETKISLYTYLERKLEGKQTWLFARQEWHETDVEHIKIKPHIYTKRRIIIITILLILMVIGGFLFSWFIWK